MDYGQASDILRLLIPYAQAILAWELEDPKHSALLQKVCAAQPLPPGDMAARFIDAIGHGITCADEDDLNLTPYYDLINELFSSDYVETTLKKINEYFRDAYPKHSECVQKYCECVKRHGSREEGYDLLFRLYICDCLEDYDVLTGSIFMMGYAGWKASLCLPFYGIYACVYNVEAQEESRPMAGTVYFNVCTLFTSFDQRSALNASSEPDIKKIAERLKDTDPLHPVEKSVGASVQSQGYFQSPVQRLYGSKYFVKYYKNRRAKLCEKMKCEDGDLEKAFRDSLSQRCAPEQYGTLESLGAKYNIQPIMLNIIRKQQLDKAKDAAVPDLDDDYLRGYYMKKLDRVIFEKIRESGPEVIETITRRDLYNEIGAQDIEEDIGFLTKTWMYDILFQCINDRTQDYYRCFDFFPDDQVQSSRMMELQRDLASCQGLVAKKNCEIAALAKKLKEKRPQPVKNENEKKLRMELNQANKEKDGLRSENEALQQKIKDLEKYIDMVEQAMRQPKEEEGPAASGIDEAILHSIRIVFVCGDADQICPDLRKSFPGCIVHETATQKAALKQTTDLVVYFTQHISHTMFFRFRAAYDGIPEYFYNGTNIDKLKAELSAYIKNTSLSTTEQEM